MSDEFVNSCTRNFTFIGGPAHNTMRAITMEKFFWPESVTVAMPASASLNAYDDGKISIAELTEDLQDHRYEFTPFIADIPNCLHLRTFVYVHCEHEVTASDVDEQLKAWGLM